MLYFKRIFLIFISCCLIVVACSQDEGGSEQTNDSEQTSETDTNTITPTPPNEEVNSSNLLLSPGSTFRVSVSQNGIEGNGISYSPSISDDGQFVVFGSSASNLTENDTNEFLDVFIYNTLTGELKLVSKGVNGVSGNGNSYQSTISGDGRFVVFGSSASNLVSNDTNGFSDVFLYDTNSEVIKLISVTSDGTQGNNSSNSASISDDGRIISFASNANNLVNNDVNNKTDIFVYDQLSGEITIVSVAADGSQILEGGGSGQPDLSGDGRFVTFISLAIDLVENDLNSTTDVFVHDRQSGNTSLVSVALDGTSGNSYSFKPTISDDGRYIAFESFASNLVIDDENGNYDVFVRDQTTHTTLLVSTNSDGSQGNSFSNSPSISGDGQFVAFHSSANNLVIDDENGRLDVFVHNLWTRKTDIVSTNSDGSQGNSGSVHPSISGNGKFVAYRSDANNLVPDDLNGEGDVFVHLLNVPNSSETPTTLSLSSPIIRLSVSSDGVEGNGSSLGGSISDDGRYVVFHSRASNLVPNDSDELGDIFLRDIQTGEITLVSVASDGSKGNGWSRSPTISGNGQFVVYDSKATNLVPEDNIDDHDIFVHDLETKETTTIPANTSNNTPGGIRPSISDDGRYVVFTSIANNLVSGDTNNRADVFLYDRDTLETSLVSISEEGILGNGHSNVGIISGNGQYILFRSDANNLVEEDSNRFPDIFVYNRLTGITSLVPISLEDSPDGTSWARTRLDNIIPVAISDDGQKILFNMEINVFDDNTGEILNSGYQVFLHDLETGETTLISKSLNESLGNFESYGGDISDNGRYVIFSSDANNLVPEDDNIWADVFIHDLQLNVTSKVSLSSDGIQGNRDALAPFISGDGRFIGFTSLANNFVTDDNNNTNDVFLRDIQYEISEPTIRLITNQNTANPEPMVFEWFSSNKELDTHYHLFCITLKLGAFCPKLNLVETNEDVLILEESGLFVYQIIGAETSSIQIDLARFHGRTIYWSVASCTIQSDCTYSSKRQMNVSESSPLIFNVDFGTCANGSVFQLPPENQTCEIYVRLPEIPLEDGGFSIFYTLDSVKAHFVPNRDSSSEFEAFSTSTFRTIQITTITLSKPSDVPVISIGSWPSYYGNRSIFIGDGNLPEPNSAGFEIEITQDEGKSVIWGQTTFFDVQVIPEGNFDSRVRVCLDNPPEGISTTTEYITINPGDVYSIEVVTTEGASILGEHTLTIIAQEESVAENLCEGQNSNGVQEATTTLTLDRMTGDFVKASHLSAQTFSCGTNVLASYGSVSINDIRVQFEINSPDGSFSTQNIPSLYYAISQEPECRIGLVMHPCQQVSCSGPSDPAISWYNLGWNPVTGAPQISRRIKTINQINWHQFWFSQDQSILLIVSKLPQAVNCTLTVSCDFFDLRAFVYDSITGDLLGRLDFRTGVTEPSIDPTANISGVTYDGNNVVIDFIDENGNPESSSISIR